MILDFDSCLMEDPYTEVLDQRGLRSRLLTVVARVKLRLLLSRCALLGVLVWLVAEQYAIRGVLWLLGLFVRYGHHCL